MANQTSPVDTSVRMAFAVLQGVLLGITYPLLSWLFPNLTTASPYMVFILIIPILSYLTSMGINSLLQFIQCKKTNMGQVAMASAITPGFALVFAMVAYWLPFVRSPIESLVPITSAANKDIWGYMFYFFWAGIYGQTIGSGLLTNC